MYTGGTVRPKAESGARVHLLKKLCSSHSKLQQLLFITADTTNPALHSSLVVYVNFVCGLAVGQQIDWAVGWCLRYIPVYLRFFSVTR